MRLNLCTPLLYTKLVRQNPMLSEYEKFIKEDGEILLYYELNPVQSLSIEPDKDNLLGNLVFIGQKSPAISIECIDKENLVSVPQGLYLFTQRRSEAVLSRDEWLELAIEQQKDGLWERDIPKNLLYVRFLFEDGAFVTQVLRAL